MAVSINDAANELLLFVFSHCDLKSLIASQGVSQRWRQLTPLADIVPERRALLELYLDLVSSEIFIQSRQWTLANLRPFDRHRYVEVLLQQHDHLPEAYRLWILEWPARAVIGCCWPGLPSTECTRPMSDGVNRQEGWNWQGFKPPQVSTLYWDHWVLPLARNFGRSESSSSSSVLVHDLLPGILVWTDPYSRVWLVLDQREGKHDKVYKLEGDEDILRGDDGYRLDVVFLDWVGWQRGLWEGIVNVAEDGQTRGPRKAFGRPIQKMPRLATRIPARPWRKGDQVRNAWFSSGIGAS